MSSTDSDSDSSPIMEKTYNCTYCNKVFTKSYNVLIHERDHLEKRFHCKTCGHSWRTEKEAEKHVKPNPCAFSAVEVVEPVPLQKENLDILEKPTPLQKENLDILNKPTPLQKENLDILNKPTPLQKENLETMDKPKPKVRELKFHIGKLEVSLKWKNGK